MTESVPRYEEVYVVSDLHLGGSPGAQIFSLGTRLAATIDKLRDAPAEVRRALVINGDFIDFLAEGPAEYFSGSEAIAKLNRIIGDAAFAPVFEALKSFVGTAGRSLVIVLGNHDVELALPEIQQWLTDWLTGLDSSKVGRIHWATDGAGFNCLVGSKRVLCLHGNEFDDWNVVDHLALLQYIRASNRDQKLPAWTPNGGTRLVIDVMNAIKREYPMVDLLKPETKAALPMALALSPSFLLKAGAALKAESVRRSDAARMAKGLLGADSTPQLPPSETSVLLDALGGLGSTTRMKTRATRGAGCGIAPEILAAQRRIENNESLPLSSESSMPGETLGLSEWWEERRQPTMRTALSHWLASDRTFELDEKDDTARAVDDAVGGNVDYVIAGHTHLRRALKRRSMGTYYFNTGTWIRLIQIDKALLVSDEAFQPVFDALASKTMAELDSRTLGPNKSRLIKHLPTVASVAVQPSGRVIGQLNDVAPDGSLTAVANSQFPRA